MGVGKENLKLIYLLSLCEGSEQVDSRSILFFSVFGLKSWLVGWFVLFNDTWSQ